MGTRHFELQMKVSEDDKWKTVSIAIPKAQINKLFEEKVETEPDIYWRVLEIIEHMPIGQIYVPKNDRL